MKHQSRSHDPCKPSKTCVMNLILFMLTHDVVGISVRFDQIVNESWTKLRDVSDEAVVELVDRIIKRENETTQIAIDSLATVNGVARNVAERLLTGRLAEEFFLTHSESLVSIPTADVVDMRYAAQGYDFAVRDRPECAIEVKGLKATRGVIQFTDREWREAGIRRCNYWLVVIGNIAVEPTTRVIHDPCTVLTARSVYRQSIVVEWHSSVSTT